MSRKPKRPRYKGSSVSLQFFGSDYLDNNHHLPTMIHTLGVQVDKDCERPDIRPCNEYRIEVLFEDLGEKVRRLSQSSPYRKGVLDTLEVVYEKAHATESIEAFRDWMAIQLANYEEE